jgi:hypothetical protein
LRNVTGTKPQTPKKEVRNLVVERSHFVGSLFVLFPRPGVDTRYTGKTQRIAGWTIMSRGILDLILWNKYNETDSDPNTTTRAFAIFALPPRTGPCHRSSYSFAESLGKCDSNDLFGVPLTQSSFNFTAQSIFNTCRIGAANSTIFSHTDDARYIRHGNAGGGDTV